MALAGGPTIERGRMEVVLEAQNRAQGTLQQFGAQVSRTLEQARRHAQEAGQSLRTSGEQLSAMTGRTTLLGRGMIFLGGALRAPLLGLLALGQVGMTALGSLLGILGRVVSAVVGAGIAIARWLGQTALNAVNTLAKALTALGVAAVAALGLGTRAAMEFAHGMRYANSIMQLGEAGFAAISGEVKQMAAEVGEFPAVLARGLYDIASSGFKGAEGMNVLGAAAKAGVAGLTETATAARALTAVLNAYGMASTEAGRIADIMFKSVEVGVFTFGDLAQNMGDVVASAAAAQVPFEEIAGAFATMTKGGITASETATALNRIILSFLSPADDFAAALKAIGIESGAVHIQATGLAGAVEALNQIAAGNPLVLANMGLEMRALKAALSLTRQEGRGFAQDVDAMVNSAGAMNTALSQIEKSPARAWQRMKVEAQLTMIALGEAFGPALTSLIEGAGRVFRRFGEIMEEVATSDRWQAFLATLQAVFSQAEGTIMGWLDWLAANWGQVWDWVAEKVGAAAEWVAGAIGGVIEVIRTLVANRGAIWDWAQTIIDAAFAVGRAIEQYVIDTIQRLPEKMGKALGTVGGAAVGLITAPTSMQPWGQHIRESARVGGRAGEWLGRGLSDVTGYGDAVANLPRLSEIPPRLRAWAEQQGLIGEGSPWAEVSGAWGRGSQAGQDWLANLRAGVAGSAVAAPAGPWQDLGNGAWLIESTQNLSEAADTLTDAADTIAEVGQQQIRTAQEQADYFATASSQIASAGAAASGAGGTGGDVPSLAEFAPAAAYQESLGKMEQARGNFEGYREALASQASALDEAIERLWPLIEEDPTTDTLNLLADLYDQRSAAQKAFQDSLKSIAGNPLEQWDPSLAQQLGRDISGAGAGFEEAVARVGAAEAAVVIPTTDLQAPQLTQTRVPQNFVPTINIPITIGEVNSKQEMKRLIFEEIDEKLDEWWEQQMGAEAAATGYQN